LKKATNPVVGFGDNAKWYQTTEIGSASWDCGFCGTLTSSEKGYFTDSSPQAWIRVCASCKAPTFFSPTGEQYPGSLPGEAVAGLPSELEKLYSEARKSASAGAQTAAVMACRKMLMNVAVHEGAQGNDTFAAYVNYLDSNGYVPPNGKAWVDYIRSKGNEATHEINLMDKTDSTALIKFTCMLLKFVYELPTAVPGPKKTQ
jgi:hypothetical protein